MANWARICSISYSPGMSAKTPAGGRFDKDKNNQELEEQVAIGPLDSSDLIVLPEIAAALDAPIEKLREAAETIPGPSTQRFGQLAAHHRCYLALPLISCDGDKFHNSCVLLDRQGQLSGTYHKYQLTIGEMEQRICPGDESPVWQTDFARMGCLICFDLNFHELREQYAKQRVQLLIFPSMYRGGLQARMWAYLNQAYFVAATPGENSLFIDPMGQVIDQSWMHGRVVTRRINFDYEVLHIDYNNSQIRGDQAGIRPRC